MAQTVRNLPAIQETQVQSLGQEDPLEQGMATHSRILAWRIPWTEEPDGLQFMGWQRDTAEATERARFGGHIYKPRNPKDYRHTLRNQEGAWNRGCYWTLEGTAQPPPWCLTILPPGCETVNLCCSEPPAGGTSSQQSRKLSARPLYHVTVICIQRNK